MGTHAAVKDELNIVASVADAAAAEHRLVARRARTICQQLDRGRSPARVAAEQAPELATALRQASRRTSDAATLVLRAIVRTLLPGAYTAIVDGNNGGTGTALVEVYDLSPTSNSTLGNISTRGAVGPQSDVMIGGFIVSGTTGVTRVLVRTVAPSLASAGVTDAMPDPMLELRDGNGMLIAANDNWREGPELEIEQSNLAPTNDLESAIITSLPSGRCTLRG